MLFISINPNIWTKSPWSSIPESQRRTVVFPVEHTSSTATQGQFTPRPSGGGLVNGAQYIQGQTNTHTLVIGVNGEHLDETVLTNVFSSAGGNETGGTLQNSLAHAVQAGILQVQKSNGTFLTYQQIYAGEYV